ncbi:STAS-like domain-containing protein [Flavobacterium sp.]|uniref:STAS-like domain-containing protein n=1 Tax=Flavobacterium sp. TaxID=239 RepID=UPI003A8E3308
MNVKMLSFGSSLSSRLKGREVFNIIKPDVLASDLLVLDFEGINLMTLSFGTELFDSLNYNGKENIEIINANQKIESIIKFCMTNLKPVLA